MRKRPRVLVLGAGFGGLTFCRDFHCPEAEILLVDRQNHHLFQPLLYQVATAGLSAPEIAQPVRTILAEHKNVTVLMEDVVDFRLKQRQVELSCGTIDYDYLVLALGGVTSYFGHGEWEKHARGLKTLDDALQIRRDVLLAFEQAESAASSEEINRLMTIAVVGGGPTGVELAGAFAELALRVLARDFRRVDPRQARILLIEAAPRLLLPMSPGLAARAEEQLRGKGVEVRTSAPVESVERGVIRLKGGERIEAANIVWAAGISASPLTQRLGVELDRAGRVKVKPDLSLPGRPEVFAIGDMAFLLQANGKPVPGVSPAAMQEARHVARIVEGEIRTGGEVSGRQAERPPFKYHDKGTMATIGRSAAVAEVRNVEFSGLPAWLAWLAVHLVFLVGFRNKMAVLLQWAYSYFAYKRGARIILGISRRERER